MNYSLDFRSLSKILLRLLLSKLTSIILLVGVCLSYSCSKGLTTSELSDRIFDAQATFNDHIKNMILRGMRDSLPGDLYFTYNEIKYLHEIRNEAFHELKKIRLYRHLIDTIYVLDGINIVDSKLIKSNIWGRNFDIYYSNFETSQEHRKLNVRINDIYNDEILEAAFGGRWQKMKEDLKIGNKGQILTKSKPSLILDGYRIIGLVLMREKDKYKLQMIVTFEEY